MENKIYIDTNILIDLLDSSRPYANDSFESVQHFTDKGIELFINSDTVTNSYYVLTRTKKYEPKILLSLLQKVVSLFTVVPVENSEVTQALALCQDTSIPFKDYEDALQYVCAKKIDAAIIVTNDKGFVSIDIEAKHSKDIL